VQEILARRAAKLAQALVDEDGGEQVSLLLVRLGREVYGLEAQYVDRIEPVEYLTRVPRVPEWVAGMTNLRGCVYSVVDLRRYFGLPLAGTAEQRAADGDPPGGSATRERAKPHLVIVRSADMDLALLVDDVLAMERVPRGRVQAATGIVRGLPGDYVRGVAERQRDGAAVKKDDASMVVMLDLPALLANGQLVIHKEIV
jgi:purine-binding chemotaxis protein CheW